MAQIRTELKTEIWNRERASYYTRAQAFEWQRPIRDLKVKNFAKKMREGGWRPHSEIHIAVLPSGKQTMINGYHRGEAIILSDTEQVVDVIYKHVENETDANIIYGDTDRNTVRHIGDSMIARLGGSTQLTRNQIKTLVSVIQLLQTDFVRTRNPIYDLNDEEMQAEIVGIQDTAALYFKAVAKPANGYLAKFFNSLFCTAVGIAIIHHKPEEGFEFFQRASEDNGLSGADYEKQMTNHFLTAMSGSREDRFKRNEYAQNIANYWNMKCNKTTGCKDSFPHTRIVGTPFNGHSRIVLSCGEFVEKPKEVRRRNQTG